jgi:hypothetical protein
MLAIGGCSSDGLAAAGQPCTASAECGAGLLCDFGKTPHVCATKESIALDMAMKLDGAADLGVRDLGAVDLQGIDLAGADLSAEPDLAMTD